ncbi:hypothetical protein LK10_12505 [Sinomonas humi]|uniref:Major facilitator superfamily (MFS) profile domain-containing protein n=1 Tax=Sinomonas humi TaxID=1338436 RepID=A0A0B2AL33_9MICC|nr:hypothetical protein LK10_12505 [Sinomonas humi]
MTGSAALRLAVGVVLLEFVASVSSFVAGTLLPLIEHDLTAAHQVQLLVTGGEIGMFAALPLSAWIVQRIPPARLMLAGLALSVIGSATSALSVDAWMFAGGRFIAGVAGGVLSVFGVTAAIHHLEDGLRAKVVAAMSAMWLIPSLVGPPATLALQHFIGWRLTLLAPIPLMLLARAFLLVGARSTSERVAPSSRAFLIPLGVTASVLLVGSEWWYLAPLALGAATVGYFALMPAGTAQMARGAPAAFAGLTLFGFGYFGANSLTTLLFTQSFGATLLQAGIALSTTSIAWAIVAPLAPRLRMLRHAPSIGMGTAATGTMLVSLLGLAGASWLAALCAWTLTGIGIGLSYPTHYLRATTAHTPAAAAQLATAAVTTESFGALAGATLGAGFGSLSTELGIGRGTAWLWAFSGFAMVLAFAAIAAARTAEKGQSTANTTI